MALTTSTRVVTAIFTVLFLISPSSSRSEYSTAAKVATGCAIGAGLLGLVGAVSAGISYLCSESDEQVADKAHNALYVAEGHGRRFRTVYCDVFESGAYIPNLQGIEMYFLLPIAIESWKVAFSVPSYITEVTNSVAILRDSLTQVAERMRKLERDGNAYTSMYHRLSAISSQIHAQLPYLEHYAARLNEHRTFFELYACEADFYNTYTREMKIGRDYQHDPYLAELYILKTVSMHGLGEYPFIRYRSRLQNDIEQLRNCIHTLRYHYPVRTTEAQQLLTYLQYVYGIVDGSQALREEKRAKREAEERAELLAYQARQTAALEANARAAQMEAEAQRARAYAERERNCIEREKYGIAPARSNTTVSVTFGM